MSALIGSRLIYLRCVRSGCGQSQQGSPLFDHLVGAGEHGHRHVEAERLRGLQIQEAFNFGGLLNRQIGWLVALENSSGVSADQTIRSVSLLP